MLKTKHHRTHAKLRYSASHSHIKAQKSSTTIKKHHNTIIHTSSRRFIHANDKHILHQDDVGSSTTLRHAASNQPTDGNPLVKIIHKTTEIDNDGNSVPDANITISIPVEEVNALSIQTLSKKYPDHTPVIVTEATSYTHLHPIRHKTFKALNITPFADPDRGGKLSLSMSTTLVQLARATPRSSAQLVDHRRYNHHDPLNLFLARLDPIIIDLDGSHRKVPLILQSRTRNVSLGTQLRTQQRHIGTTYRINTSPHIFNAVRHFGILDPEWDDSNDYDRPIPTSMGDFAKECGVIKLKKPVEIPLSVLKDPKNIVTNAFGKQIPVIFGGQFNKGSEMKRIHEFFESRQFQPISQLFCSHNDIKQLVAQLYVHPPHWLQWSTSFNPCGYTTAFLEHLSHLENDVDRLETELLFWQQRLPTYIRTGLVKGLSSTLSATLRFSPPKITKDSLLISDLNDDANSLTVEKELKEKTEEKSRNNPHFNSQDSVFNIPHTVISKHTPVPLFHPLPEYDPSVDKPAKLSSRRPSSISDYARDFGVIPTQTMPVPMSSTAIIKPLVSKLNGAKMIAAPLGYWNTGTEMKHINAFFKKNNFTPISQKFRDLDDCYNFLQNHYTRTPRWVSNLTNYNLGGYSASFLEYLNQHIDEPTAIRSLEDAYWESRLHRMETGRIWGANPEIKQRQKEYDKIRNTLRSEKVKELRASGDAEALKKISRANYTAVFYARHLNDPTTNRGNGKGRVGRPPGTGKFQKELAAMQITDEEVKESIVKARKDETNRKRKEQRAERKEQLARDIEYIIASNKPRDKTA